MSAAESAVETLFFKTNGRVPNSRLPVLIHRRAVISKPGVDLADVFEETLRRNDWLNNWREVVYDYYHFHSTTHEVLSIAHGQVVLRLGGQGGSDITLSAGDVLVLPAGVSHNQIHQSSDLLIVGGYPEGRAWDLVRDEQVSEAEAREAILRIATLPIPHKNPVTGETMHEWRDAPRSFGID